MATTEDDGTRREGKRPGGIHDVFRVVDRLPFLGSLKGDLAELRRLLYDRRTPHIAAIGVRGSGRTSLANALLRVPALPLGESPSAPRDAWIRIDAGGRRLDWLEIDAGPIDEARLPALRRALDETPPDLTLVVVRANAIAAEGALARETLDTIAQLLADAAGARPAVVGVVSHVDRLAAPEVTETGAARFRTEDLATIDAATQALKNVLGAGRAEKVRRPVPVLAGGDAGAASGRPALRWNVEEVANAMYDALPDAAKVEAARALAVPVEVQRELARTIVNHCSAAAVTIGLMPIPFSDAILLLPLQGVMISAIAYLAGQPWDRRAAFEWLGSIGLLGGAAFGLRWGAQQLVKLSPGAGSLVSGSVAGAGTLAIGRSAIAYFVDGPGRRDPDPIFGVDAPIPDRW
jgi:uncharacterized protein (DUF697 family)